MFAIQFLKKIQLLEILHAAKRCLCLVVLPLIVNFELQSGTRTTLIVVLGRPWCGDGARSITVTFDCLSIWHAHQTHLTDHFTARLIKQAISSTRQHIMAACKFDPSWISIYDGHPVRIITWVGCGASRIISVQSLCVIDHVCYTQMRLCNGLAEKLNAACCGCIYVTRAGQWPFCVSNEVVWRHRHWLHQ